jgi:predicted HD phosphohydrolase
VRPCRSPCRGQKVRTFDLSTSIEGADHIRYLTATEPGYYEALSQASKTSLKYQGGPFSEIEVTEFQKDPLWKEKVALRRWDDQAKVVDLEVPGLDTYRAMAARVLSTQ